MNHNKLLWSYEGASGIKNGFTNAAGFTLVSSARRGDTELIGVILKSSSSDELYTDMSALLDYGFEHAESIKIINAAETKTFIIEGSERAYYSDKEIWLTLEKGVTPELTADPSGNVFVLNSVFHKPDQPIAEFVPIIHEENSNLPEADLSDAATEVQAVTAADRKSPWVIMFACAWFLQLVFMASMAAARRRARHR